MHRSWWRSIVISMIIESSSISSSTIIISIPLDWTIKHITIRWIETNIIVRWWILFTSHHVDCCQSFLHADSFQILHHYLRCCHRHVDRRHWSFHSDLYYYWVHDLIAIQIGQSKYLTNHCRFRRKCKTNDNNKTINYEWHFGTFENCKMSTIQFKSNKNNQYTVFNQ